METWEEILILKRLKADEKDERFREDMNRLATWMRGLVSQNKGADMCV